MPTCQTARTSLTLSQKLFLLLCFVLFSYAVWLHLVRNSYLLYYLISAVYFLICFHKLLLIITGLTSSKEIKVSEVELFSCRDWPGYTILLPVYREKEILPQLVKAIDGLDYPKDKLEVLILLEEDDAETRQLLDTYNLPAYWKRIVIPDGPPRTKGKALNYGLQEAQGKYLVIYDAEDIPEHDQLKKAVVGFNRVSERVVCLQAKLNYYNPYQNILTQWFTAEYSTWFDLYLPGLDAVSAPIPLGGTSNHFRTEVLKQLKGWDPFNVTEDCDLGTRIFRVGYCTKILDTTTWEEANSRLDNWVKQRSRWVKGYIQTYFVHVRDPFLLLQEIGPVNFLHFHLVVAGNFFVLLFNPFAWALLVLWLVSPQKVLLPNFFFQFVTVVLALGNGFFVLVNILGCLRRKYYRLVLPSFLSPLYWVLMSVGAWKGLVQFLRRPHFWEKTDHALFRQATKP